MHIRQHFLENSFTVLHRNGTMSQLNMSRSCSQKSKANKNAKYNPLVSPSLIPEQLIVLLGRTAIGTAVSQSARGVSFNDPERSWLRFSWRRRRTAKPFLSPCPRWTHCAAVRRWCASPGRWRWVRPVPPSSWTRRGWPGWCWRL